MDGAWPGATDHSHVDVVKILLCSTSKSAVLQVARGAISHREQVQCVMIAGEEPQKVVRWMPLAQ
jgi:hypothetical protein